MTCHETTSKLPSPIPIEKESKTMAVVQVNEFQNFHLLRFIPLSSFVYILKNVKTTEILYITRVPGSNRKSKFVFSHRGSEKVQNLCKL